MKTLTISIAAYNVEKYLNNTLDSLIDERIIDDLEVYIVNDGSSDNTLAIAKEYERRYPNSFFVIDKGNGGYGSTINESLKQSSGKYYKLLDGDDWYDTEELVKFVDFLKRVDADLVVSPFIQYVNETKEERRIDPLGPYNYSDIFSYRDFPKGVRISLPQVCFKTNIINDKEITISENCFYTDTEFLLKCMSKCHTIIDVNFFVYVYRIGLDEQSTSLNGLNRHYKDVVKYFKEMINYYNNGDYNSIFREYYFEDSMISLARYHLTNFLLLSPCRKQEYLEFEKYIKDNAPKIYEQSKCKSLSLLRKTHNLLFRPMNFVSRKMAKKKIRV